MGLLGLGVMAVSACSRSVPEEAPPPPPAVAEAPPPVLAGGPVAQRPGWGTMAPIANPRDMSPADRARIYGARGHHGRHGWANHAAGRMPRERMVNGHIVVAMAPIPNPGSRWGHHGRHHYRWTGQAPVHHRAWSAAPSVHHAWRAPARHGWSAPAHAAAPAVHAAPAPRPVHKAAPPKLVNKPAPVQVTPPHDMAPVDAVPLPMPGAPVVKPAPKPVPTASSKLDGLKAALAGGVVAGSHLDVPSADLKAGKEAKVSLSLPDSLLASIQNEAAKLGLGKAARKATVSAKLTGEGYSITPNGAQTARLTQGKPTTFSWMVHPTGEAREPLTASVDASLNGDGKHKAFSLLTLQSVIAALPDMDASAENSMKKGGWLSFLDIPGHRDLDLPGGVKIASHNLVALAILAVILLILVNIANGASRRRARAESRRRRQALNRSVLDGTDDGLPYDTPPHHGGGLAMAEGALGGAALGAFAAHEVREHEGAEGHHGPGMLTGALGGAALGAFAAHEVEVHREHEQEKAHEAEVAAEHAAADRGVYGEAPASAPVTHEPVAEAAPVAEPAAEPEHPHHGHGAEIAAAALGAAALGAFALHEAHKHHEEKEHQAQEEEAHRAEAAAAAQAEAAHAEAHAPDEPTVDYSAALSTPPPAPEPVVAPATAVEEKTPEPA